MKKSALGELYLLHLSDLHIAPESLLKNRKVPSFEKKFWGVFLQRRTRTDTANWSEFNLNRIISAFNSFKIKIDHVVITGDCVTCGLEEEFKRVRKLLLDLQDNIFNSQSDELNARLFSIIPGNHDVSTKKKSINLLTFLKIFLSLPFGRPGIVYKILKITHTFKRSYSLFREYFGNLYSGIDFLDLKDGIYCKKLNGTNINIIHLITSTKIPVHFVSQNALGEVSERQLNLLSSMDKGGFNILIMHHNPLPYACIDFSIPYVELINSHNLFGSLLLNQRINLILCGHAHTPYIWQNARLPSTAPALYQRYDIPMIMSGASTQGEVGKPLYVPIYKIETADKNNIRFENSNIVVFLLSILSDSNIQLKYVTTLNASGLGERAFQCLRELEVDERGSGQLTAAQKSLIVEAPEEGDFIDVPFEKPAKYRQKWELNIECDRDDSFVYLEIDKYCADRQTCDNILRNKRIKKSAGSIFFDIKTSKPGYVRIKLSRINSNRLIIRKIQNEYRQYL